MDKNTTMLQLFQEFDKATSDMETLRAAVESLKRSPDLDSVSYTAEDDKVVIGETYIVKSAGEYTIQCEGSGRVSWVVKEPKYYEELYSGDMSDTDESTVMYLTSGDIAYLHSSADTDCTEKITLQQKSTLFEAVYNALSQYKIDYNQLNVRVGNLAAEFAPEYDAVNPLDMYLIGTNELGHIVELKKVGEQELEDYGIALAKDLKLQMYSSPEEFGSGSNLHMNTVLNAMPENSILLSSTDLLINSSWGWPVSGVVMIFKKTSGNDNDDPGDVVITLYSNGATYSYNVDTYEWYENSVQPDVTHDEMQEYINNLYK